MSDADSTAFWSEVGERVRIARLDFGMTQEQLGYVCGRSRQTITQLESGKQRPGFMTMCIIAYALGVPLAYLVSSDALALDDVDRRLEVDKTERERQRLKAALETLESHTTTEEG